VRSGFAWIEIDDGPARIGADRFGQILARGRGEERGCAEACGRGGDGARCGEIEPGAELIGDERCAPAQRVRRRDTVLGVREREPPLLAVGVVLDGPVNERRIGEAGTREAGEHGGQRAAEEIDGGGCAARGAAGALQRSVRAAEAAALQRLPDEAERGGFARAAWTGEEHRRG
jgi:hypothetical protein